MAKRGFVYVLGNESMPDFYKIGCTERSPHERAYELSAPSGVPLPFSVLCYMEVDEFQAVERKLHDWFSEFRVSTSREFFRDCFDLLMQTLWHYPGRLSFCDATEATNGDSELRDRLEVNAMAELDNPFLRKVAPEPEPVGSLHLVVANETEAA